MAQLPIVNNQTLNPNSGNTTGINWVPGLNGAKAWKMYPNTMDVLMDSENDGIHYIKAADNLGMCSVLRAFKSTEIQLSEVPTNQGMNMPSNFVTKDDFESFKTEILDAIKTNGHYNKGNRKSYNGGEQMNDRT